MCRKKKRKNTCDSAHIINWQKERKKDRKKEERKKKHTHLFKVCVFLTQFCAPDNLVEQGKVKKYIVLLIKENLFCVTKHSILRKWVNTPYCYSTCCCGSGQLAKGKIQRRYQMECYATDLNFSSGFFFSLNGYFSIFFPPALHYHTRLPARGRRPRDGNKSRQCKKGGKKN